MIVYYCITMFINVIFSVIFRDYINITYLSLIPLLLIVLMIFQAVFFKTHKIENGFKTNYGSNLTDKEENDMQKYIANFMLVIIPLMIPFIFFFSSFVKILSIIPYIISLLGGMIIFRFKNKDIIIDREEQEEKERKEQEKREQLGKWK